jgi:hypothetical protein
MKPVLIEGKLSVELNVRERATLLKAAEIGVLLLSLHQETGEPLVAAIETLLKTKELSE